MKISPQHIRFVLAWALAVVLIAALGFYARAHRDVFARILDITPTSVCLLTLAWILLSVPRGLIRRLLARGLGVDLTFVDWYGLNMVTNMMALVFPTRTDLLVSAVYLRQKYGLSIIHFVSLVYANAILLAGVLAVEGLIALFLLRWYAGYWDARVAWIVASIGLLLVPFILLRGRVLAGESWIARKVRVAIEGWETIRSDRILLSQVCGLIVTSTFIFAGWMYVSYHALGIEAGFLPAFIAGIVSQLSFFFNLTPGNLGVREAMVGFISQILGLGFAEGIAVTLLQRALSSLIFLVIGGVFSLFVLKGLVAAREEGHE